ncbi:30S ribosomal protein S16 [bacterium]|nr:30S ribosomal protein S16 [bacterium]
MIKIRLSRGGTKKRPVYKVVIADSRRARDGKFIEKVGFFNPLLPKDKKERVGLEAERIKYWIGQGAQPTARVARILGENDIIPMPANTNNPNKAIPKKERKKEGDEAAPASAAPKAEEAPKEAAPKAEEAPKEAAPKAEAPKAEAPKAEAPKEAAPKAEAPKEAAPKAEAAPKEAAPKAEEAPKEAAPKAEAAPKEEAPKAETK